MLQSLGSGTMYFSDENLALLTMAGPQFVALTGFYKVLHEQDPHFNSGFNSLLRCLSKFHITVISSPCDFYKT